jgi:hypothetical protein
MRWRLYARPGEFMILLPCLAAGFRISIFDMVLSKMMEVLAGKLEYG